MKNQLSTTEISQMLGEEALGLERETSQKDTLLFLTPAAVAENCELAGFEAEAISYLQSMANRIATDSNLKRLAWHCHYLLCRSSSFSRHDVRNWTPLTNLLGEFAGSFFLLIALSSVPHIRAFHQSRNIPESIARDTYSDTSLWAEDYKTKHGAWGISLHILPWLFNHLSGELYRLGRLQFIQRPFRQKFRAFRNRLSRQVVVLAEEGTRYRSDGQIDGTGGEFDPENGWTSRFLVDSDRVVGTPIHPIGMALCREVNLPLKMWECILTPGQPILEIHIPAGSPMDFDACGDSLRQAIDFFPRYFPDRSFQGFCCTSWLLNTQYQDWLSPTSNIVRFQREFYLFPTFSNGQSGLARIFDSDDIQDLSNAPRDTSLRRAVLDGIQAEGYLRSGGALLFPGDLDWEKQVYRTHFDECRLVTGDD